MRDGCKEAKTAPPEVVQVDYRGAELQLLRQSGNCDLQEVSGLGWTEVADYSECGIERAVPIIS